EIANASASTASFRPSSASIPTVKPLTCSTSAWPVADRRPADISCARTMSGCIARPPRVTQPPRLDMTHARIKGVLHGVGKDVGRQHQRQKKDKGGQQVPPDHG